MMMRVAGGSSGCSTGAAKPAPTVLRFAPVRSEEGSRSHGNGSARLISAYHDDARCWGEQRLLYGRGKACPHGPSVRTSQIGGGFAIAWQRVSAFDLSVS